MEINIEEKNDIECSKSINKWYDVGLRQVERKK